jgi:hypothetical protein
MDREAAPPFPHPKVIAIMLYFCFPSTPLSIFVGEGCRGEVSSTLAFDTIKSIAFSSYFPVA